MGTQGWGCCNESCFSMLVLGGDLIRRVWEIKGDNYRSHMLHSVGGWDPEGN